MCEECKHIPSYEKNHVVIRSDEQIAASVNVDMTKLTNLLEKVRVNNGFPLGQAMATTKEQMNERWKQIVTEAVREQEQKAVQEHNRGVRASNGWLIRL